MCERWLDEIPDGIYSVSFVYLQKYEIWKCLKNQSAVMDRNRLTFFLILCNVTYHAMKYTNEERKCFFIRNTPFLWPNQSELDNEIENNIPCLLKKNIESTSNINKIYFFRSQLFCLIYSLASLYWWIRSTVLTIISSIWFYWLIYTFHLVGERTEYFAIDKSNKLLLNFIYCNLSINLKT